MTTELQPGCITPMGYYFITRDNYDLTPNESNIYPSLGLVYMPPATASHSSEILVCNIRGVHVSRCYWHAQLRHWLYEVLDASSVYVDGPQWLVFLQSRRFSRDWIPLVS